VPSSKESCIKRGKLDRPAVNEKTCFGSKTVQLTDDDEDEDDAGDDADDEEHVEEVVADERDLVTVLTSIL
jgi:hypothetical protein